MLCALRGLLMICGLVAMATACAAPEDGPGLGGVELEPGDPHAHMMCLGPGRFSEEQREYESVEEWVDGEFCPTDDGDPPRRTDKNAINEAMTLLVGSDGCSACDVEAAAEAVQAIEDTRCELME